jgi:hypothetical protein
MKKGGLKVGLVAIIVAAVTISISCTALAAEKKKFVYSKKSEKVLSEININDRTDEKIRIRLWSRLDILTEHSDPSLIGAEETEYGQMDRPASIYPGDKATAMGYTVTRSKDGDCYYAKFQSTRIFTAISSGYMETEAETKIQIFGGTGKYSGVKGSGTCKTKGTVISEIGKCEGE